MRRASSIAVFTVLFVVVATTVAFAGRMQFNKPVAVDLGGSLIVEGSLVGVGGGKGAEVTVTGTASAEVTAICENKGGNQAPGRNPVFAEAQGSATFGPVPDNGKVQVSFTIPDPTFADLAISPRPKTAGCPNGKWTVVGIDASSINWTFLNITATSPTNPTYVIEGPCVTDLNANSISCALVEAG